MVKNKKGGSGHKKYARKHAQKSYSSRKVRLAVEEGEIYARITRIFGGEHAAIYCSDGVERTLVIRGKFRGRNKRDNAIKLNTMVLVGLRSDAFGEVVAVGKKPKADLIFVYNDSHLKELKKIKAVYDILSDEKKKEEEDKGGFIFSNKTVDKEDTEKDSEKEVLENKKLELDDTDIVWDDI